MTSISSGLFNDVSKGCEMSGGSMNYLYSTLEREATFLADTPLRKAFMKHLSDVKDALHDIEWVDSGDYSPGDEDKAIRACLNPGAPLASAIEEVNTAIEAFHNELAQIHHV